jgi:hypothetical protein
MWQSSSFCSVQLFHYSFLYSGMMPRNEEDKDEFICQTSSEHLYVPGLEIQTHGPELEGTWSRTGSNPAQRSVDYSQIAWVQPQSYYALATRPCPTPGLSLPTCKMGMMTSPAPVSWRTPVGEMLLMAWNCGPPCVSCRSCETDRTGMRGKEG